MAKQYRWQKVETDFLEEYLGARPFPWLKSQLNQLQAKHHLPQRSGSAIRGYVIRTGQSLKPTEDYFAPHLLANQLGISRRRVDSWRDLGLIYYLRRRGGRNSQARYYLKLAEVQALLQSNPYLCHGIHPRNLLPFLEVEDTAQRYSVGTLLTTELDQHYAAPIDAWRDAGLKIEPDFLRSRELVKLEDLRGFIARHQLLAVSCRKLAEAMAQYLPHLREGAVSKSAVLSHFGATPQQFSRWVSCGLPMEQPAANAPRGRRYVVPVESLLGFAKAHPEEFTPEQIQKVEAVSYVA